MPSTTPTVALPGSTVETGVIDAGGSTGSVPQQMVAADQISDTSGAPLQNQVVVLANHGAVARIIELLTNIENRLAHLEEAASGYAT